MYTKHEDRFKQLGLNIAYYRKMRGFSQEALGEKISISRTHISNIEAPRVDKSPSLDVLFDIADALSISVSKLFEFRYDLSHPLIR